MIQAELTRYYTPIAVLGELKIYLPDGRTETFATVEKPWKGNKPFESCIPEGEYVVKRHNSPKFRECYQVQNVFGRTHILLHTGNTADDVVGCIAIGTMLGNEYNILQSRLAFNRLLKAVPVGDFNLSIKPFRAVYP